MSRTPDLDCWPDSRPGDGRRGRSAHVDATAGLRCDALFLIAFRVELLEVRPQLILLLGVAHAGEGHAGALNLLHRVADVLLEYGFVPGDARILHCIRVAETGECAGLAAIDPVQGRPQFNGRARTGAVTRQTPFVECSVGRL